VFMDFALGSVKVSPNLSKSKANADHLAVSEQSGILAGDDGFQVNIQNHTDLKGGIITSTQKAENDGKNTFKTGSISTADLQNHSEYDAKGFAISGGVDLKGGWQGNTKDKQGKPTTAVSKSIGYGKDSDKQSNITKSGIGTDNITITDKTNTTTAEQIKTTTTTEQVLADSGLQNRFDKDEVQSEIDLQVKVTQEFDKTRQKVKAEIYKLADKKRNKAIEIRKDNVINGKNGYNTKESLALDKKADSLEEVAFYTDLALGGVYGIGNSKVLKYVGSAVAIDPIVRAATIPAQAWEVKCEQDGLYCSNMSYDGKTTRPIYGSKAEIGDKRQLFDVGDIQPSETTGLITISNNGIFNPRDDALKNAVKQNSWETNKGGVVVVYNRPTSNPVSEILYAAYSKANDLAGGRLPLTSAEQMNIDIYNHATNNNYSMLDLNNHSRGGLTASIALQRANREGLTGVPIRQSRFQGTATYVPDYANQLVNENKFTYIAKDADGEMVIKNSEAYSAAHHTDFVARSPLVFLRSKYIVGGNKPTGGVEDKPLMYSHSGYFGEIPEKILKDESGNKIDENGNIVEHDIVNPYFIDYKDLWGDSKKHKLNKENLSSPILIKPSIRQ
ncbi:MAG: hypothetical protein CSA42_07285, partial [Gammaproteobacteria bacterium]